ncbi:nonstructural protein [Bombyx mori densovirus 5]|uniref:Nonstructural protein n=2 Tax=Iteradensovirus lepidopteran1 TaxID=3052255 RepID=Q783V1_BMDNS|nr:NS2 [Bombyx mori densovirus 1]NP_694835.1 nonstructural protein [Bombyx mori densovirus 5]AAK55489.1 NS2 [Bombyx mori densovirus 1]BAA96074.1 nonstructural protein [Bombyx mori densovirus 5]
MLILLVNFCLLWSLLKSLQMKFQVKQRPEYLQKLETVMMSTIQDWDTMMKVVSAEEEMIEFLTEEFSAFIQKDCKNNSLEELYETVDEPKLVHSSLATMKYYLTLILQNKAKETTDLKGHSLSVINKWNSVIKTPLKLLSNEKEASTNSFERWNAEWESSQISYAELLRIIQLMQEEFYTTPLSLDQATDFVKWFTKSGELLIAEVRTLFGSMKQIKERKTTQKTLVEDTHPTTISESYRLDTDTAESQQSSQSESEREEENRRNRPSSSRHINTTRKRKSITTSKGVLTKKKSLKNQPRAISTYFTPADGTIMNAGASGGALTSIQGRIRQSLSTRSTRNIYATLCSITQNGPDGLCTSKWPTDPNSNMFIELNLFAKNQYNPSDTRNNWKRATIRMKVDLPDNSRHAYQLKEIIDAQMSRMEDHPETETQSKSSWSNSNSGQHGPWNTY